MIVTSINAEFLPALGALHNSIKVHSPSTPLACLTYGDDELAQTVRKMGIEVRHNLPITDYLPPGNGTKAGCEPMYARILVPMIYENCVWLDADQIVRADLSGFLNPWFSEPVAAVKDTHGAQRSVDGIKVPSASAIMSGLMAFNVPEWRKRDLTNKCFEIMRLPNVNFKLVVQSVLNVALAGDFHSLHWSWQGFANRKKDDMSKYRVLHWHGRGDKPWTHPDMPNAEIWWQYA